MDELFDPTLGAVSNALFTTALVLYLVAMFAAFFRMAQTAPEGTGADSTRAGRIAGYAAVGLAASGALAHTVSLLTRGLAAERVPWANMYEYSSGLALITVVAGLVVLTRLGLPHLLGFVLGIATVTMAIGLTLYTDPGPVVPALQSYWIRIHVSTAMLASGAFMVAFAANALYLVKDTAERRLAAQVDSGFTGSTVGAAGIDLPPADADGQPVDRLDDDGSGPAYAASTAQRATLRRWPFLAVPFLVVAPFVWVVADSPGNGLLAGAAAAGVGLATWWSVPYLPSAARLDLIGYRTIAFGFPIWTFAVIAGAVWAEQAWGRYWGWDPKETGSFFTWLFYAAYLHARSTAGWRGRRAAWIAVLGFAALMVTYYVVNLFVVGLHSYAGV